MDGVVTDLSLNPPSNEWSMENSSTSIVSSMNFESSHWQRHDD